MNLPDERLKSGMLGYFGGAIQTAKAISPGLAVSVDVENSFAVTQATWRFFGDERATLFDLVEPLRRYAWQLEGVPYVLAVVDWSQIDRTRSEGVFKSYPTLGVFSKHLDRLIFLKGVVHVCLKFLLARFQRV